jgi:hypothetical protein
MSVKPNNAVPVMKDRLVNVFHDFSSAINNTGKPVFVDPLHDWEVVEVKVVVSVAHIASNAVTYDIGHTAYLNAAGATVAADTDHFVAAQTTGTAAKAAGSVVQLTQTATKKLPKGAPLVITSAAAVSQTGEGILSIRLRPYTPSVGNSGKRPKAAQSPS